MSHLANKHAGYTVIEVMLFLAISMLIFLGAAVAIGGRQAEVQFTQSVRDFESKLQDVINDVSIGYFPHSNDFRCFVPASGNITFDDSDMQQGTSDNCVFLGKALQFDVDSDPTKVNLYTIVGIRSATTLANAQPVVVANVHGDLTEAIDTRYGVEVTRVARLSSGYPQFGSFAFVTRISGAAVESGASVTDFMPVSGSSLGESKAAGIADIDNGLASSVVNPAEGIIICLQEGGGGRRRAAITIGGSGRGAVTQLDIDTYDRNACP